MSQWSRTKLSDAFEQQQAVVAEIMNRMRDPGNGSIPVRGCARLRGEHVLGAGQRTGGVIESAPMVTTGLGRALGAPAARRDVPDLGNNAA